MDPLGPMGILWEWELGSTTVIPWKWKRAWEWLGGNGNKDITFFDFPPRASPPMQLAEKPVLKKNDPI